jgi:hypothetical protein
VLLEQWLGNQTKNIYIMKQASHGYINQLI